MPARTGRGRCLAARSTGWRGVAPTKPMDANAAPIASDISQAFSDHQREFGLGRRQPMCRQHVAALTG